MIPRMGNSGSDIPVETQMLLLESRKDMENRNGATDYILFLPMLDGPFRSNLQGNSLNELEFCTESGSHLRIFFMLLKIYELKYVVKNLAWRTRKGKHSESFWPSIVMRKWLNIKPKVHEFSEDEVDTESEDDGEWVIQTVDNENAVSTQTSGLQTKGPSSRLRRRKSETLRVEYINKKDVRVMIGSWNVAGRVPFDDLEIDQWLCTGDPADLYILGLFNKDAFYLVLRIWIEAFKIQRNFY